MVEAERDSSHMAIDRERRPGERRSPERRLVEPAPAIGEAGAVAPDHGQAPPHRGCAFEPELVDERLDGLTAAAILGYCDRVRGSFNPAGDGFARARKSWFIPGDFFGLHAFLLGSIDHFIGTVGPTRLAEIDRDTVIEMVTHHPRIRAALWWSARQEDAMLRERIVALGRRSARGRVAYLLCELVWRQRATGVNEGDVIRLPLTQIDLADALGLTPIYVNRILQAFRREQLITLQQHQLTLLDVEKLQTISGVTPDYLQLGTISPDIIDYFDPLGRSLGGSISHPTPKSAAM